MRSIVALVVCAGLTSSVLADVVIKPTAIAGVSTWRACVPDVNTINGSGLTTGGPVDTGSPIPVIWPVHATGGCNNMWHSSCIGQPNNTSCEGGDLTPFITFDLGNVWNISGFRLWNHNQVGTVSETNRGWRNVQVSFSNDNVTFSTPAALSELAQAPGLVTYAGDSYPLAATTRYVKFEILQNWGSTAATGLSEIRFIGTRFGLASVAATPANFDNCAFRPVTLTARIFDPATITPSTTVNVDFTAFGGGVTPMFDNGIAPDAVANDGVYTVGMAVAQGAAAGTYSFPITASNGTTSETLPVSITVEACDPTRLLEATEAGDLPASAQIADSGSGTLGSIRGTISSNADADMYRIRVCDHANFSASLVGGATYDTQLFLFDANGLPVVHNDDTANPQSAIDATLVTADGDYYLAISAYNRDPVDNAAQLLWVNTPFTGQRAPNGPGAANPISAWVNTANSAGGAYTITLTGACFVGPPPCPADLGVQGGGNGQDGMLDNNDFVAFINLFFAMDAQADVGVQGGGNGSDGAWDNNDFVAFINLFFQGCGM